MSEERAISDASFQEFLAEERLMGCRCRHCGALFMPPTPACTCCYRQEMEWLAMPQTGTLAAFTCITVCPPAMKEEGFGRDNPYCTGVVALADGLRVTTRIHGVDARHPETIRVGMPMQAAFQHQEKDGRPTTLLGFRPA